MTEAEIYAELGRVSKDRARAYAKIRALGIEEKRLMGSLLVSKGWRKVKRGWVEPGTKNLRNPNMVFGTIAAFQCISNQE